MSSNSQRVLERQIVLIKVSIATLTTIIEDLPADVTASFKICTSGLVVSSKTFDASCLLLKSKLAATGTVLIKLTAIFPAMDPLGPPVVMRLKSPLAQAVD